MGLVTKTVQEELFAPLPSHRTVFAEQIIILDYDETVETTRFLAYGLHRPNEMVDASFEAWHAKWPALSGPMGGYIEYDAYRWLASGLPHVGPWLAVANEDQSPVGQFFGTLWTPENGW